MKTFPLLLGLFTLTVALPVLAQQPGVTPRNAKPSARTAAEAVPELKRLDLDFPGGTPDLLVAAISQALGQALNAIIPLEQKDTKIMPIKVVGVTVPELFSALESATSTEQPVVTSAGGGSRNVQYRSVAMGFRPNTNNVTDTTVWSFFSTAPTPEFLAAIADKPAPDPNQVCHYFQLAPYLEDHTIEDITTAIQTGWKMLKVDPLPQLSFHPETKLLIAVGPERHILQIPQVLNQLQQDNTAAVEKIVKWQAELAELEAKKEPALEKKVQELKERIDGLAARERARDTLNSPGRRTRVVKPQ